MEGSEEDESGDLVCPMGDTLLGSCTMARIPKHITRLTRSTERQVTSLLLDDNEEEPLWDLIGGVPDLAAPDPRIIAKVCVPLYFKKKH